jgi:bifunctional DNA-binding transcriptional regulator/antitoxin component of YhaV-PrlF toxin-antitoxin module
MKSFETSHAGGQTMTLVTVRRAAQITLPREIGETAHLVERDYLEAEMTCEGICPRGLKP